MKINIDYKFNIDEIVDNEDGSATVKIDCDENFKKLFLEAANLQEWDDDVFSEWFNNVIQGSLDQSERNQRNPDFLWDNPEKFVPGEHLDD